MSRHALVLRAVRDLIEEYSDQAIGSREVAEHVGTTDVDAVAQALRELQRAGYLVLCSECDENGKLVEYMTSKGLRECG